MQGISNQNEKINIRNYHLLKKGNILIPESLGKLWIWCHSFTEHSKNYN